MAGKTYLFQPEKKILKQGYLLEDDSQKLIYEAKCLKAPLIGASTFEFVNHLTGRSEEHKVGSVPVNNTRGALDVFSIAKNMDLFSVRPGFKYDGKDIWAYFMGQGVQIAINFGGLTGTSSYVLKKNGQEIATLATYVPAGKKAFMTGPGMYTVETTEEYLDLAFLAAFALARGDKSMASNSDNN